MTSYLQHFQVNDLNTTQSRCMRGVVCVGDKFNDQRFEILSNAYIVFMYPSSALELTLSTRSPFDKSKYNPYLIEYLLKCLWIVDLTNQMREFRMCSLDTNEV
jgi:hypothetical protein